MIYKTGHLIKRILTFFTNYFFLWTVLTGVAAFLYPPLFTWILKPLTVPGIEITMNLITNMLGLIMLGMGLTLSIDDFKRVLKLRRSVLAGVLLQYTLMPFLGWFAGYLFELPAPYVVGLILVSCCPGGTASNVISFLARANVALSVSMTAVSTSLAIFLTPVLVGGLVGNRLEVDVFGLFYSTLRVVVIPITVGVLLNQYAPRITKKLQAAAPAMAVLFIVLIVGAILAGNRDKLFNAQGALVESGLQLIFAVFFLHSLGFLTGYLFGKVFTKEEDSARTISIEVGMQNSGLGVVLARANFTNPLVAVPAAISAICHCTWEV